MKLHTQIISKVDEVYDPTAMLTVSKNKLRLALEMTPTSQHNPCHDLFRVYTFTLLQALSKQFDIVVIYRDLQATLDIPIEKAKKLIQENASLLRNSKVPFQTYYESEIFRNHIVNTPDHFFLELYHSILHKNHNVHERALTYSSASMALVFPMLRAINVDVLLCMDEEKENFAIIEQLPSSKGKQFPVIFYRSFPDMKNNRHNASDTERVLPRIGWGGDEIYEKFVQYGTSFATITEWYTKLGIVDKHSFTFYGKRVKLPVLLRKKIAKEEKLRLVADDLSVFLEKEGLVFDLASKETKMHLSDKKVKSVLDCLNTPKRLDIIMLLGMKELSAAQIAQEVKLSLPTTIFHLKKLQDANIISRNKDKVYRLETSQFLLHT